MKGKFEQLSKDISSQFLNVKNLEQGKRFLREAVRQLRDILSDEKQLFSSLLENDEAALISLRQLITNLIVHARRVGDPNDILSTLSLRPVSGSGITLSEKQNKSQTQDSSDVINLCSYLLMAPAEETRKPGLYKLFEEGNLSGQEVELLKDFDNLISFFLRANPEKLKAVFGKIKDQLPVLKDKDTALAMVLFLDNERLDAMASYLNPNSLSAARERLLVLENPNLSILEKDTVDRERQRREAEERVRREQEEKKQREQEEQKRREQEEQKQREEEETRKETVVSDDKRPFRERLKDRYQLQESGYKQFLSESKNELIIHFPDLNQLKLYLKTLTAPEGSQYRALSTMKFYLEGRIDDALKGNNQTVRVKQLKESLLQVLEEWMKKPESDKKAYGQFIEKSQSIIRKAHADLRQSTPLKDWLKLLVKIFFSRELIVMRICKNKVDAPNLHWTSRFFPQKQIDDKMHQIKTAVEGEGSQAAKIGK